MSMQKTGRVTVKVNGRAFLSYPGAEIDIGGMERTTKTGHRVHGYTEKERPGLVKFEIDLDPSISLKEIGLIKDATVIAECDTGQSYVGRNWWCVKTPTFKDGDDGKVEIEMTGLPMDEMGAAI